MKKPKQVTDVSGKTLPAPGKVALTKDNCMIFATKFLEEIRDELKKLNATLEKNG